MAKENRKYKDTVFTDLFYSDINADKNLLSLYNALHGTALTDTRVIEKIRLEDVLFMNQKNDIAFSVNHTRIILGEHQSTVNPNMPLRFLQYVAREYEKIVKESRYSKSLIRIPTPEFVVFYIGKEDYPDRTLRLSDAFLEQDAKIRLDLAVKVVNINQSCKNELLSRCDILDQYSKFVETVRKYQQGGDENPLECAIRECMKQGILREYLSRKSEEVVNMLMDEYSYEEDIRTQREEAAEKATVRATAAALLQAVVNLGKNCGFGINEALNALGKTRKEYDAALKLLSSTEI